MKRLQTYTGEVPEFTAITVLPGRGMDIASIKAYLPGRGETELLSAPSLSQIAALMTGTGSDSHGEANVGIGGAFLVPFANPLAGAVSADGKSLSANVHGRSVSLPVVADPDHPAAPPMARFGLLSLMSTSIPQVNTMPDGSEGRATYETGNFGGHWPGKLQVTVSALLSGRAIDLLVSSTNTGSEPVPVSTGWYPRLAIPSGNRAQATVRLPKTSIAGNISSSSDGFNARQGKALGAQDLEVTLVNPKPALFDNGPTVELRDPAIDYGLRVVGMSASINGIRVFAPSGKNWIVVSPIANPTDSSGKPLDGENADDLMLAPGKTLQWRVRLELFIPSTQVKAANGSSTFDPIPARP
ncbi:aldose epimerase family protein [Terriglobus albidus]|uniref:hypothetical protein n=1 Tax=Terriglobus albidus TaxID=1592106 RepID=UPI0021E039C8|nr:hypothetical protein [Terriglobus albidus]